MSSLVCLGVSRIRNIKALVYKLTFFNLNICIATPTGTGYGVEAHVGVVAE